MPAPKKEDKGVITKQENTKPGKATDGDCVFFMRVGGERGERTYVRAAQTRKQLASNDVGTNPQELMKLLAYMLVFMCLLRGMAVLCGS